MSPEIIVMLCSVGGALGGAAGAWVTMRVTVALHGQRLHTLEVEVSSLRHDRHQHASEIQRHEGLIELIMRGKVP